MYFNFKQRIYRFIIAFDRLKLICAVIVLDLRLVINKNMFLIFKIMQNDSRANALTLSKIFSVGSLASITTSKLNNL